MTGWKACPWSLYIFTFDFECPLCEVAPSWWTLGLGCQLLCIKSFKISRAEIGERRMAPTAIIERFDIFENSGACGGTRLPLALVNQFRFQASEKAFRDGVVPTISTPAHAPDDPVI